MSNVKISNIEMKNCFLFKMKMKKKCFVILLCKHAVYNNLSMVVELPISRGNHFEEYTYTNFTKVAKKCKKCIKKKFNRILL